MLPSVVVPRIPWFDRSSQGPTAADVAELGGATDPVVRPKEEAPSSQDPTAADVAELGGATDAVGDLHLDSDVSSRLQEQVARALSQTQLALVQAQEGDADWGSASDEQGASPDGQSQNRERSRSPRQRSLSPKSEGNSPSPDHSPVCVSGHDLPTIFVAALQDLLWPAKFQEMDRPADLVSFDSSLSATVMVDPFQATLSVATLILALREVALDHRAAEAQESGTFPVVPNLESPLTREEIRLVLEYWLKKFDMQTLTQEQDAQDKRDGYTNAQLRKRKRSRFYSYMNRALGNRKVGMALITMGFNADLNTLAIAYAQVTAAGDAPSLPSSDLRRRVLSMRSWYRWGRQLYNSVDANKVAWESLGPRAKSAWTWYKNGWSGAAADKMTRQYGHGMLRTGQDHCHS
jgi:hypothetical protein